METWMNWAIFLVIAGAIGFYYTQQNQGQTRGRPITRTAKDASLDWIDSASKSKPAKQAQAKTKAARKSVKNAVEEVGKKVNATVSAASSSAGADGDDDLSPVTSPAFRPLATSKAPSGKDVSDMLAPQSAAPSVMSIKPSEKPARPSKPQALKAEAPQESKKARQNRKKAEEAKAAREAEEKERQALQEKQRRTAREARGEPAKNGMASAQAPSSNAWTTVGARGAVQAPVAAPAGQLLDTFEAAPAAAPAAAPSNGTRTAPSNNAQPKIALSEDEQVKMAVADSTEWETVPKGKKQKKKVDSDTEAGAPQVAQPVKPVHIDKPVRPAVSENKRPSSRYQILTQDFVAGQDDPNDWPVV